MHTRLLRRQFSTRVSQLKKDLQKDLSEFIPARAAAADTSETLPPYLSSAELDGAGRGVYVETYAHAMKSLVANRSSRIARK